jgi:sugar O-acyltransferase (sialic acid O-acetyltransferase NeuD family)
MTGGKLVIYGNGQMARMFVEFAREQFDVVGFTVDRTVLASDELSGLPVVPFEDVEVIFPPADHLIITAVGYLAMNTLRAQKFDEARAKGYRFANYVHPSVIRHPSVTMGTNNVILDHLAIHPGCRLGNSNFVSSNASIGHGCVIGDNCWINSGVSVGGETQVGDNCFFGINATIGDNIEIGARCYVGANTLVTRNTADNEVYISPHGERFPLPSADFLKFIGGRQS